MANFMELPIAASLNVSNTTTGSPFTDNAVNVGGSVSRGGIYVATNEGYVYAANVDDKVAFISIGMGYKGYVWQSGSAITVPYEVESTKWSTIYAVLTPYSANLMDTTVFPSLSAATEMFYNQYVAEDYEGVVVVVQGFPSDSMDKGGTSDEEFPEGDFDDTSDVISEPALPTIGAQNSGMVTLFRPSLEQVQNLGSYIWTHLNDFFENLQKWLTDPSGYIISFHIVPCVPSVGSERNINIGNFVTEITMPPCVSQWYTYDFGYVFVSPYSGTYLDYSPFTKIQLFLPFIGSVQLNTDEVMGKQIGIKYHIDLLSGQCVALISLNGSYLYQFTGECSVPIPLTGNDWSRVYAAAVGAVSSIAMGVAAGTAGAGAAWRQAGADSIRSGVMAGNAASRISSFKGAPAMRDRMAELADLAIENAKLASQEAGAGTRSIKASRIANTVSSTVGSVMGAKQQVMHSGTVTGSAGMLGIKQPFVIIEYPNQSLADNYKHFVGYPSNISGKLKEFSGYTECEQVIPNGFTGTDSELAEVLELLKEGVYL